jgi:hypothetical protein
MKMGKVLAAASSAFGIMAMSHGAATGGAISEPSRDLSVVDQLSNDPHQGPVRGVSPTFAAAACCMPVSSHQSHAEGVRLIVKFR